MHSIVFDIGGTHLRSAVSDGEAKLDKVEKERIPSFIEGLSSGEVWQGLIEKLTTYALKVEDEVEKGAPIVLSFPGPVEHPSRILSAPTLVGNERSMPDLAALITRATGRRTYIINDLSAAAWYLQRNISDDRFIVVTVSSGIGSKIFDRTRLSGVLDNLPFAGEIGHITMESADGDVRCDCGGMNHIGAISSGRGVERLARSMAISHPECFRASVIARQFKAAAEELTNEAHIVPAARLGDPWALDIIARATAPLARALLAVTVASGLERVVVIGGFALSLGDIYLKALKNEMLKISDYDMISDRIEGLLVMGKAGEEACLEGAALYALSIR